MKLLLRTVKRELSKNPCGMALIIVVLALYEKRRRSQSRGSCFLYPYCVIFKMLLSSRELILVYCMNYDPLPECCVDNDGKRMSGVEDVLVLFYYCRPGVRINFRI